MGPRIRQPEDPRHPPHPFGPRRTVPLEVVSLDRREEVEREEREAWARNHGPIPGVELPETDPLELRSGNDIPTIHRAVKSRWRIPEEVREQLGETMADIALRADNSRDRINAAKVLATLDSLNQRDEARADPKTTNVLVINAETVKSLSDEELQRRLKELESGQ